MIPRYSFQDLYEQTLARVQETSPTPYTNTFVKNAVNEGIRETLAFLDDWTTQKTSATITRQGRQFYHLPPDCDRVETAVVKIDYCQTIAYPLMSIDSTYRWNQLNLAPINTVGYPTYFYVRKREIGIWPIPQQDNGLLTIYYTTTSKELKYDDVTSASTSSTVSATNDSDQVTFTAGFLDESYIGRWIAINSVMGDGLAYRIVGVINQTTALLENVYHGDTASAMDFEIGDCPDVPPEMTDYICDYAAGLYFSGLRKDDTAGQRYLNRFWTGDFANRSREMSATVSGLLGIKKKYNSKTKNNIIYRPSRGVMGGTSGSNFGWPFPITP